MADRPTVALQATVQAQSIHTRVCAIGLHTNTEIHLSLYLQWMNQLLYSAIHLYLYLCLAFYAANFMSFMTFLVICFIICWSTLVACIANMDPDQMLLREQSDQSPYCLLPWQKKSGVNLNICSRRKKETKVSWQKCLCSIRVLTTKFPVTPTQFLNTATWSYCIV